MVVSDVGCGTGILALMACRAGAARVYALDTSDILDVARRIAAGNGVADRITFIESDVANVSLPEGCDVALSDFVGHFGYDAGLLAMSASIGSLLKPGGVSIPSTITMAVTAVECPEVRESLDFWRRPVAGFDIGGAFETAVNTPFTEFTAVGDLLASDVVEASVAVLASEPVVRLRGTVDVERDGILGGLAAWCRVQLAPGIEMTNAPRAMARLRRRNVVLPIARPIEVSSGDEVTIDVTIRPIDLVVSWRVTARGVEARHSSFESLPFPAAARRP